MYEEWTTPEDRNKQYHEPEKRDKSKGPKLFDKYNRPCKAVPPNKNSTSGRTKSKEDK